MNEIKEDLKIPQIEVIPILTLNVEKLYLQVEVLRNIERRPEPHETWHCFRCGVSALGQEYASSLLIGNVHVSDIVSASVRETN